MTVVESQILSDFLDFKIKIYREKFADKFIETTARNRAKDPQYDQKINDAFKKALGEIEIINL